MWRVRPSNGVTVSGRLGLSVVRLGNPLVNMLNSSSFIVKTLAIRGTAEETMAARRLDLKDSQDKLPKFINEKGMRDFIAVCIYPLFYSGNLTLP